VRRTPYLLLALVSVGCSSGSSPISSTSPPVRQVSELSESYVALQGVWTVKQARAGTRSMPEKAGLALHFDGNRFWIGEDSGYEVVEVDTSAEPFKIDFWEAGSAVQGVYRVADTTLSICSASPGISRPKDLDRCDHPQYILTDAQRHP
jgi:uncharacterized protein (TIGR03067 family)